MRSRWLVTMFGLIFLAACGQRETYEGEGEQTEEIGAALAPTVDYASEISTVRDAYTTAFNTADLATLAMYHTEDAIVMPPSAPQVEGRQAIQDWMSQGFSRMTAPKISFDVKHVEGTGDIAWEDGTATTTGTMDGKEMTETAKYLAVLKKDADGTWKYHRWIWNLNEPSTM